MRLMLFIILLLTFLHATTLHGEILNSDDFQGLNNTVIKINGPTSTQFVAAGNYSIELQEGNYTIIAYFYEGGKLKYYSKDQAGVSGSSQRFDLVLLPSELQDIPGTEEVVPDVEIGKGKATDNTLLIATGIIVVAIIAFLTFMRAGKKENKNIEKAEEIEDSKETREEKYELDEDSKKILKILEEQEGRMMQRELREILNFSETKMSLIMAELETIGHIKRIKKGRENIVKLKKQ